MAHPTPAARIAVDLSPRALLSGGVSGVLAADLTLAESGRWSLATRAEDLGPAGNVAFDEAPAVQVVTVRGPIDQRATAGICGGMTDGYDSIEARFGAAVASVKGKPGARVVLAVDSPGGMVSGAFPTFRRMRRAAEEAGVFVEGVADVQATSAGYGLLLVADRVNVEPNGRTASVGVVMVRRQDTEAGAVEVFRSGERKMRPNSIEALDAKDRAELQAMVDRGAAEFAAWVAERRGLSVEDVLALEGASLSGEDAARRGLTDGTFTAHEVIAMALQDAARAELAEAAGLPATASEAEIKLKIKAGAQALADVETARAQAAEAASKLLAFTEREAREKAQAEAQGKRAAFAAEVKAACDASSITPPREAALLAHYDAHGEASARATFDLVKASAPIVARKEPGAMPTPSAAPVALTDFEKARAKQLGMTEAQFAAAKTPTPAPES